MNHSLSIYCQAPFMLFRLIKLNKCSRIEGQVYREAAIFVVCKKTSKSWKASGITDTHRGIWRPYVINVICRYLECGYLHFGFARWCCDQCGDEYLLTYSCNLHSPNVVGHQYFALPFALTPNHLPGILGLTKTKFLSLLLKANL
jgi:hypothetical protein